MMLTHPTSTLVTISCFVPPPNSEKAYQHINTDPLTRYMRFDNGDKEIIKEYYPESIELIKELTGANNVVLFNPSMSLHIAKLSQH